MRVELVVVNLLLASLRNYNAFHKQRYSIHNTLGLTDRAAIVAAIAGALALSRETALCCSARLLCVRFEAVNLAQLPEVLCAALGEQLHELLRLEGRLCKLVDRGLASGEHSAQQLQEHVDKSEEEHIRSQEEVDLRRNVLRRDGRVEDVGCLQVLLRGARGRAGRWSRRGPGGRVGGWPS